MNIINISKSDYGIQVVIELEVKREFKECGVLPLSARWRAAANSLKKMVDISPEYSIIEIRAGRIIGHKYINNMWVQEFQFTYSTGEQNDSKSN